MYIYGEILKRMYHEYTCWHDLITTTLLCVSLAYLYKYYQRGNKSKWPDRPPKMNFRIVNSPFQHIKNLFSNSGRRYTYMYVYCFKSFNEYLLP